MLLSRTPVIVRDSRGRTITALRSCDPARGTLLARRIVSGYCWIVNDGTYIQMQYKEDGIVAFDIAALRLRGSAPLEPLRRLSASAPNGRQRVPEVVRLRSGWDAIVRLLDGTADSARDQVLAGSLAPRIGDRLMGDAYLSVGGVVIGTV